MYSIDERLFRTRSLFSSSLPLSSSWEMNRGSWRSLINLYVLAIAFRHGFSHVHSVTVQIQNSSSADQPSNARTPKYKQTRNTTKSATENEHRSQEKRSQNDSRKKGEKQMQRLPHTNNYGNENDYSLILLV